jgi:hypothetical protein
MQYAQVLCSKDDEDLRRATSSLYNNNYHHHNNNNNEQFRYYNLPPFFSTPSTMSPSSTSNDVVPRVADRRGFDERNVKGI